MKDSDQKLIRDYSNGNDLAFATLLKRYINLVYNFVYRTCRNNEDAEEIVQDTFFKAWKSLKKYREKESFKTWLFTIAKNTMIDLLRKKRSFVFSDFSDKNDDNKLENILADEAPLPEEILIKIEEKRSLEKILEKLPIIYRQLLLLRYQNDFSFQEISKILDKPIDTIRSQHRRALAILREILLDAPN